MSAIWYVQKNGTTHGPHAGAKLKEGVANGKLSADDLVRKGEHGQWVKASQIRGLFAAASVPPSLPANNDLQESPKSSRNRVLIGCWLFVLVTATSAVGFVMRRQSQQNTQPVQLQKEQTAESGIEGNPPRVLKKSNELVIQKQPQGHDDEERLKVGRAPKRLLKQPAERPAQHAPDVHKAVKFTGVLGDSRFRGDAWEAALSSDGSLLAKTGFNHRLSVWEMSTGRRRFEVTTDRLIRSLAFDPKGELLAMGYDAGGADKVHSAVVEVRSAHSGKVLYRFSNPVRYCVSVSFSADSRRVAADTRFGARIWDLRSRKLIRNIRGPQDGQALEVLFNPKRTLLAVSRHTKSLTVDLWNYETGKHVRTLGGVGGASVTYNRPIAFSPDGRLLAVLCSRKRGSYGRSLLRVFDVSTGKERFVLKHPKGWDFISVAFSRNGEELSASALSAVIKVDVKRGVIVDETVNNPTTVNAIGFSADDKRIVVVGNFCVRTWDYTAKRYVDKPVGHEDPITSLAFVPGRQQLASRSDDHTVRLWNLEKGTSTQPVRADSMRHIAPSPSGRLIAYVGYDVKREAEFIVIRDARFGKEVGRVPDTGTMISSIVWDKGEAFLAGTARKGKVMLWSIPDMKQQRSLVAPGVNEELSDICFLPNGRVAAYGYDARTIHVWNIADGSRGSMRVRTKHKRVSTELRYNAHMDRIVLNVMDEKTVQVWNPNTLRQERRILTGQRQKACSNVPGTALLASAEYSYPRQKSTIRFWDISTGDEVAARPPIDGDVRAVCFDDSGTRMALGFKNGLIRVLTVKQLQRKARQKCPSKQLLTESDFWRRASIACGGEVPRDSIGMRVAFAKVTLLERFLLIAEERLSETNYYALLRYMVRKEFISGGRLEVIAPFFATKLSSKRIRAFEKHIREPSHFHDGYVEWAKYLNEHSDTITKDQRQKVLLKVTKELSETDIFPELRRLRKEGRLPQNSLSTLARNRNVVVIKRTGGPVQWKSLRQIFGGTTRSSSGSSGKGESSSASSQKSRLKITVKVVREKTASYEPVRDLPLSRYSGPFNDRFFTNYKGLVSFQAARGQSIRIWVGGKDSDPVSKKIWDGIPKGNMNIEVRIRKSGQIEVRK